MKSMAGFQRMTGMTFTMVVVLLLALSSTSCKGMSENPGAERAGSDNRSTAASGSGATAMMPTFELVSAMDGSVVSSEQYRGQLLLVTFFATWCSPCLEEIPSLKALHGQLGPRGFSVIALSMDMEGRSVVKKLVEKSGINYPVLMADNKVDRGFGGVTGLPSAFLIDRRGVIVRRYIGYVSHAILERDIEELLAADGGEKAEDR